MLGPDLAGLELAEDDHPILEPADLHRRAAAHQPLDPGRQGLERGLDGRCRKRKGIGDPRGTAGDMGGILAQQRPPNPRQDPGIPGEPADRIEGSGERHDPVDGDPPMARRIP